MRPLHLILVALIAAATFVAGLFAVAVVFLAGLVAYVIRLFRGTMGTVKNGHRSTPTRARTMQADDVIEVETRRVASEPIER